MPREAFPSVPFGEFTVVRPFTAPGLFAYRHIQAEQLLRFPDSCVGHSNEEQRKAALELMANGHRPLTALVLFLGVVGLEDFIRDLGARLADLPDLDRHFPGITALRPRRIENPRPFARQDRDPAPLSDWRAVNALYESVIGVAPLPVADLEKLYDLALIRHTVAHHAALVRTLDAPRFQHWEMHANTLINPPVEFVRQMLKFLYRTGRCFETAIADRLFSQVLAGQPPNWHDSPSTLTLDLIETFDWFGKLLVDSNATSMPGTPNYEDELRANGNENRATLTKQCIEELRLSHAFKLAVGTGCSALCDAQPLNGTDSFHSQSS